jgi:hypothetical protein
MRRSSFVLVIVLLLATAAAADTGLFTSYSTTAMRTPGQLNIGVTVGTTGSVTPGPTTAPDYVYVLGFAFPTTGTTVGGPGSVAYLPRTAVGADAFSGSFSITGLNDAVNYKWLTIAIGNLYGTGGIPSIYALFVPFYYLYYGCLPITTTTGPFAYLVATSPGGTAPLPIFCTTTTYPGGSLYDFLNSDISSIDRTINWFFDNGTTTYPVWANGVSGGVAAALIAGIPTLASWGMMILGTLTALTGVILARRA